MKTIILAGLLGATAIAGVVHAQQTATTSNAAPQIGRFGFDEQGMDKSVAPGDNFYAFANGNWAKTTAIPADKASFGAFDTLADLSRDRTRTILEAAAKQKGSKIGTAYATYLDTATIDKKGLAPVQPWLTKIKAATKANYASLIAEADRNGVGVPFGAGVGQDDKAPETYVVEMRQSGLGLPDRDYYLDAKNAKEKAAYEAHIAKMFTLAGEANAAARAKALVDFETQIAQVSWTRIDSRDANKTYNKMTVAQLTQSALGFDFVTYASPRA